MSQSQSQMVKIFRIDLEMTELELTFKCDQICSYVIDVFGHLTLRIQILSDVTQILSLFVKFLLKCK
jgi:hypothetical protein